MTEPFASMLAEEGKRNSLGRAEEIVGIVLDDKSRLQELYDCMFQPDAWVRMRAADALEKVCRVHPEWITPYIDKIFAELASSTQPSIQWHLAQIFAQIAMTPKQHQKAMQWLTERLQDPDVDWIVAANCMTTLKQFTDDGSFNKETLTLLVEKQLHHKSNAVKKRALKILDSLDS